MRMKAEVGHGRFIHFIVAPIAHKTQLRGAPLKPHWPLPTPPAPLFHPPLQPLCATPCPLPRWLIIPFLSRPPLPSLLTFARRGPLLQLAEGGLQHEQCCQVRPHRAWLCQGVHAVVQQQGAIVGQQRGSQRAAHHASSGLVVSPGTGRCEGSRHAPCA